MVLRSATSAPPSAERTVGHCGERADAIDTGSRMLGKHEAERQSHPIRNALPLRRQDRNFGGLRKRCWGETAIAAMSAIHPEQGKCSIIVHHGVRKKSELKLIISLCPGCHARGIALSSTGAVPPRVLLLWRKQHPQGHGDRTEYQADSNCCYDCSAVSNRDSFLCWPIGRRLLDEALRSSFRKNVLWSEHRDFGLTGPR